MLANQPLFAVLLHFHECAPKASYVVAAVVLKCYFISSTSSDGDIERNAY